jgi:hypothetical protein
MSKIQCDNKECKFRTKEDFCGLKGIEKDENGNCISVRLANSSYEVVITLPTKHIAELCKRHIKAEIGCDSVIRKNIYKNESEWN